MKNIIEVIEAKLQEQKDAIFFKDLQIQDLKKQLAEAEKEIARLSLPKEKNNFKKGNGIDVKQ